MTVRVLQGDCSEMLRTLPDASVQCCITSPPYYALRNYNVEGQIGLEPTVEAYVERLVAVFREVRRTLRDDGTLFLNLGDSYVSGPSGGKGDTTGFRNGTAYQANFRGISGEGLKQKDLVGIPWRVAFALQADGWYLRSDIIWAKPNPMPESVRDRPTKAHEYVFLLTKQPRYFFDAEAVREPHTDPERGNGRKESSNPHTRSGFVEGATWVPAVREYNPAGRNIRSVWTIATAPFPEAHFATFPPALAERCIKAGTSEKGACPACGAPWVRVVEATGANNGRDRKDVGDFFPAKGGNPSGIRSLSGATYQPQRRATDDWQPSCPCNAGDPIPQTVLDPFGGAGTVSLVAERVGRDSIYIDLSPEYAQMARDRIVGDAPLFTKVV